MRLSLSHPEYFTLTGPDGNTYCGGDQEWFPDRWQRRAGCGPTAAATILRYLSRAHPGLAAMGPGDDTPDFSAYMEALWPHLTPGPRGLDQAADFVLGCRSFALTRGCVLLGEILEIPDRTRQDRPALAACRDFLAEALYADLPVAFLNYSSGSVDNLDNWHWVTLIAMEEEPSGKLPCLILDGGAEKVIDFTQWLNTSAPGGALAVVYPMIELEE
ncbi:MAG: hypothetical protein HUJ67_01160 [Ruminiclostridium sp.]|nr:hypothetical protein [Ruminiclostridium sp.]